MIEVRPVNETTVGKTNAESSAPVPINNATLSPERKKEIETIAKEYYEDIMSKKDNESVLNFLKLMTMLDSSSVTSSTDFISVFFSRIGSGLHDMSASAYKFYTESPITQLFIGEDNDSCIEIFRYFKKCITDNALSGINTHAYIEYEDLYRLIQIYLLNPKPMKEFSAIYSKHSETKKGSKSVNELLKLYECYNDPDFSPLLHFLSGKIKFPSYEAVESPTTVARKKK